MKPIIAIVGRPNTGKSTLFNRITRSRDAIVDDLPGVTRDRHYGDATWNEIEFTLVDTGGFLEGDDDAFAPAIRAHVEQTIADADVIVFLLDGKNGLSPYDQDLLEILRSINKPLFFAINKIDGAEKEAAIHEFYTLGAEVLYPISAAHGYGVNDFMDALTAILPPTGSASDNEDRDTIKVAIVGRPNVGKSSLVNRILGHERMVVSDIPGTTRDAVDTVCRFDGVDYRLVDTAGIRRKGKVSQRLEKFSVIKALKSLDRCDVALVVLDAHEGITEQDMKIAGYAHDRGCAMVLLLNKWDLIEKDTYTVNRYYEDLKDAAKFAAFAPMLTISALTGQRVRKVFGLIHEAFEQYRTRIGTGELNRIMSRAVQRTEPSLHRGRRIKFYYAAQVSTRPPTFVCFVNYPEAVHFSYKRYLTNQFRKGTGLQKTPLRILFRKRTGRLTKTASKGRLGS